LIKPYKNIRLWLW